MGARISRRSFLSRGSWAALWLGSGPALPRGAAASEPLAGLKRLFAEPPHAAKPMTRWWWFGGAVTPEEITRELTFMRDAGLRGAEIQPVYPVAVDDPSRGIRHLRYFTEEWFEVLRHVVREARRLGLQLDFTLGSGWPYGGPFIPVELASRRLAVLSRDVTGPGEVSWALPPQVDEARVVAVVAAPVLPNQEPDLSRALVLADQPRRASARDGGAIAVRGWRAPEGVWRLSVHLDSPTGMQVKRPTLGMEGYVLDHFSSEAMGLFLRSAGDRVVEAIRGAVDPPFHSVFCDSLEVYGADWTVDLLAEFRKRRGYDLTPLLPALWEEAGERTPHVRYDYHLTLSDLLIERFFEPLVAWSERNRMTARIQAHGAMGDVMRGYGLAHVPEGENIFGGDRLMVNLRHRRLASSAAHLYSKPLASAETYTWLRTPLYMTTLEMMKAATDSVFLDGINHVVNHGYSYSPPQAGEPGWTFYASTEANHTNTWWRHYPHLARYVQRAQALLQQGVAVNPVAVYLPLADAYASQGAGGMHVDDEIARRVDPEFLPALRRAGYDFDMIHDHALATLARVNGGRLLAGNGTYSVVIVPETRFMPPESAARILDFAEAGGHVLFVGRLPEAAPGLTDAASRNASLGRTLERLARIGKLAADRAAALQHLESVLAPDARIVEARGAPERLEEARQDIGFIHRRTDGADSYLVANVSSRAHDVRIRFAVGHRAPERWDIETGAISKALAYEYVEGPGRASLTEVALGLEPFESCFVVFGPAADRPVVTRVEGPGPVQVLRTDPGEVVALAGENGVYTATRPSAAARRVSVEDVPPPVAIDGPWTLRLGGAPALALPRLRSWTELPEGRGFSGWGRYEAEFDAPSLAEDVLWELELGQVHETAEVWLNDKALGVAWKGRRRVSCGAALVAGTNRLRVEVANLWIHHVLAEPPKDWKDVEETVGIRWGRYGEIKPESVPPSGLLGPVRLVALKRFRIPLRGPAD